MELDTQIKQDVRISGETGGLDIAIFRVEADKLENIAKELNLNIRETNTNKIITFYARVTLFAEKPEVCPF